MKEEDYFPFQEVLEEEEELDFSQLKKCPYCKKPIPYNAIICLYCGKSLPSPTKAKWKVWIAVIIVISFILFILWGW
ncbi:MAG: hypothetical protein DRP68_04205 [Candidatus Omnitrophota bacterium]|nr:MAG: hypothetical protein DRP68_04205 [Candidatus Omnitrophota bacterium]RKY37868.1 MAG: hypothetical protein DRP72_02795 [Candidatus Omnitrophota bacterium]RKY46418.1 MAG: hypothetical protein DRP81_00490 [Candidatus Omnitrophota bacterium]HDN85602.1 hypothetical protein [Candidatus Omnitrophota bacterium]